MDGSGRGFELAEFVARTARAQRLMADCEIAAMWFSTEPEVRYFTGFLTEFWQSPTRPWFVVVPAQGRPIAVIPEIGAPLMRRGWLEDIRTWPAPRPGDDGVGLLAETLREQAGGGLIATAQGPESHVRMPLGDLCRLQALLAIDGFADASPIVRTLRQVKSPAEIAKVADICARAGRAFGRVPAFARPGMPLAELFRRFRIALLEQGADGVPYVAGAAGPGGYADVISPADDRPLQRGDVLMLDTGAMRDGYACDFNRNFAIGVRDGAAADAHALLVDACAAAIDRARPGMTCAGLFEILAGVVQGDGSSATQVGRMGHGLGMQLTEWPSIARHDRTILEPGMILTLEPARSLGGELMMVHEENIVITADGCTLLSEAAGREMPLIT